MILSELTTSIYTDLDTNNEYDVNDIADALCDGTVCASLIEDGYTEKEIGMAYREIDSLIGFEYDIDPNSECLVIGRNTYVKDMGDGRFCNIENTDDIYEGVYYEQDDGTLRLVGFTEYMF